jgi:Schlafen, AlbA_2
MVPTFISSASDFQSAVKLGITTESLVLEFKATIDGWDSDKTAVKEKAQKEVCRDIAQFANTLGGCLLIGLDQRFNPQLGVALAGKVIPIDKADKLQKWIEQAITNYLVPSTFGHEIVHVVLPEGTILAVNIPVSRHLVSLWDRNTHAIEYVRRTSHGKDWMNPDDAERQLMDGSRVAKIALMEAKAKAPSNRVDIAGGMWVRYPAAIGKDEPWNPPSPITIGNMEDHWFELFVPNERKKPCSVTVPYGVVKEAWLSTAGVITILLTVRVILRKNSEELTLEPYP